MKRGNRVLVSAGVFVAVVMATASPSFATEEVGTTWLSQETGLHSQEPIPPTLDSSPLQDSAQEDSAQVSPGSSDLFLLESTMSPASTSEFIPLTLSELLDSSLDFSEVLSSGSSLSQDQLLTLLIKQNQQMMVSVSLGLSLILLVLTANLLKR